VVFGDDVGDPDPTTRCEHPEHFGEHRGLVGRQVDHAVGDDDIHRGIGQRNVLDGARAELHIARTGLGGVCPGQGEHLLGHVHAVGEAGVPDPAGGQQHVDAPTRTQIQHPLPPAQLGHRHGVAAAQTRGDRLSGQLPLLTGRVQGGSERGVHRAASAATRGVGLDRRQGAALVGIDHRQDVPPGGTHRGRRGGVARPDLLLHLCISHDNPSFDRRNSMHRE